MNNDYIIAVDENGQPYIAHAFGGHKYFQKIRDGLTTRYFYTREQLENYYRKLRGLRLMRRQRKNRENGVETQRAQRPTSHQKNITGSAVEGWSKRRTYDH